MVSTARILVLRVIMAVYALECVIALVLKFVIQQKDALMSWNIIKLNMVKFISRASFL